MRGDGCALKAVSVGGVLLLRRFGGCLGRQFPWNWHYSEQKL